MNSRQDLEFNLLFAFVVLYMLFFSITAFVHHNYEFFYYALIVGIIILVIKIQYERFHLSTPVLIGLALLGFFHLLGGTWHLGGARLYDHYFWLFRYDNFIHFFGGFVMLLVSYSILSPYFKSINKKQSAFLFILIVFTMGAGAFIEITELLAVIFLNSGPQVGDYMNNAFDIVFNFFGALAASIIAYFYRKKHM